MQNNLHIELKKHVQDPKLKLFHTYQSHHFEAYNEEKDLETQLWS